MPDGGAVQVLMQQADYQTARKYWHKLKQGLDNEGSQLVTKLMRDRINPVINLLMRSSNRRKSCLV
jgi:hypothetical protein